MNIALRKREYQVIKTIVCCLLFSFAFFLRTYQWLNYSLWYDEVIWILSAERFCRGFLVAFGKPPLFSLFLFFWQKISHSEWLLRIPSLFFGVLNIFQIYILAKALVNKKVGLFAALLLAFSPFHLYYSQELSPYTFILSLVLAGNFFLLKWFQSNKKRYQYGYILLTVGAIYTHYICLFLIPIHNIFIFFLCHKTATRLLKKWVTAQLLVIVCVIPLWSLLRDSIQVMHSFPGTVYNWMPKGNISYFLHTFTIFILGYHSQIITGAGSFLLQVFVIFIIFKFKDEYRKQIVFLVSWMVIPPILVIILGNFFSISIYTHRNFFFCLPAYLILLGISLSKISVKYRLTMVVALAILIANSLVNYYKNEFYIPERPYRPGIFSKKDHREAARYIVNNFLEKDTVLHLSESTNSVFYYYFKEFSCPYLKFFIEKYAENEKHLLRKKEQLPERLKGYKRLWLVLSAWDYPYESLPAFHLKIKSTLDKKFPLIEFKKFEGIILYLYDMKEK